MLHDLLCTQLQTSLVVSLCAHPPSSAVPNTATHSQMHAPVPDRHLQAIILLPPAQDLACWAAHLLSHHRLQRAGSEGDIIIDALVCRHQSLAYGEMLESGAGGRGWQGQVVGEHGLVAAQLVQR